MVDWAKFNDLDLELEMCDHYGLGVNLSNRSLMIMVLDREARAVALTAEVERQTAEIDELRAQLAAPRWSDELTRYLTDAYGWHIEVHAMPWGENGVLEKPLIMADLQDSLGHLQYSAKYIETTETTIETALQALAQRIAAARKE